MALLLRLTLPLLLLLTCAMGQNSTISPDSSSTEPSSPQPQSTPTTASPSPSLPSSTASALPTNTPSASPPSTNTPEASSSSTNAVSADTTPASSVPPVTPLTPSSTSSITIRFVSDLRYHLHPVAAGGKGACAPADADSDSCLGGLRCLLTEQTKAKANNEVWINAGVSLGYGDELDAGNLYPLLHQDPAASALKQLNFDAMSVDADLFRAGRAAAAQLMTDVGADRFVCANCPSSVNVKQFKTVKTTTNCQVAVIGVLNQSRADVKYLHGAGVAAEVESVQAAVGTIKKDSTIKAFYVVVGEVSEATAQAILSEVPDVGAVIYSGSNVTTLTKHENGARVAVTLPSAALGKDHMKTGQLVVTVDGDCKPTGTSTVTDDASYASVQSKCTTGTEATDIEAKKVVTEVLAKVAGSSASEHVKPVVELSGSVCASLSCAVGQMVADGVRALDAQGRDWEPVSRVAVVPASEFRGRLAAGAEVTAADLLGLLVNNPVVCRAKLKGAALWDTMQAALADADSFPQVSGMLLDVVWAPSDSDSENGTNGTGLLLQRLWAVNANLSMTPVRKDETVELSAPCQFLDRFHVENQTTGTTLLSDGLRWHLRAKNPSAPAVSFVPPQVEPRVRTYVGVPSQAEICEDWVGMTVAYTLLVLGSLIMVGYQGYQYWRFRSTLSYIR